MATVTAANEKPFISKMRAARLIGVHPKTLGKIADLGYIGRKVLPGCQPLYSRADCERLARESVRPARLSTAG